MKRCTKCDELRVADTSADGFPPDKKRRDGLSSWCRSCKREGTQRWNDANKERIAENARRWQAANRERHRENVRRWEAANRERSAENGRRWNAANPERKAENQRRATLKRRSNITLEDYDRMLESQGGRCAICGTDDPGNGNQNFDVDHDHACCPGERSCGDCVRGLLCNSCNRLVGRFEAGRSTRNDPIHERYLVHYRVPVLVAA